MAGVVCVLALGGVAAAQTSATFYPSLDNTLFQSTTGSRSAGAQDSFYTGRIDVATGGVRRGLVQFDLSSIPVGSVVTGASLQLYLIQGQGDVEVTLHRTLASWGEGTSAGGMGRGSASTPGDATWIHRFFSNQFWTTPGGDFVSTPSGSTTISTSGPFHTWSGAGVSNDLQFWINNPAQNFGWTVRGDESTRQTAERWASGEAAGGAEFWPTLRVTYVIPGPGVAAMGGLGLLAASRRRRAGCH
ncbi:MAG: DNRLRE domain-containing protein [Phycisphaerales bacterium]|nr:DNRLRE domain-containing protein [Phycisphaerales bacterium]